jgi:putative ABC transport system permease protein
MLFPLRPIGRNAEYIVRAQPGKLAAVMAAAQEALYTLDRERIVSGVRSMSDVRKDAYRDDRGFAIVLGAVCGMMLAITACGIVGLTSYWVAQRRRQIGIRRALGGTRSAIVSHFQSENLLIAVVGTLGGAAVAVGLNLWAVQEFETARLPVAYVIMAAIVVIALGQIAALWPALRASLVPPAIAARSL